jgi:CheY-like chemotaxis protein
MTRVLVVDDEPQILRALRINLHARHYDVVTAGTGRAALDAAADAHPDLVILDLGLPDIDGVDVIRSLRKWTQVPIVILSGRMNSAVKVDALDAGRRMTTSPSPSAWKNSLPGFERSPDAPPSQSRLYPYRSDDGPSTSATTQSTKPSNPTWAGAMRHMDLPSTLPHRRVRCISHRPSGSFSKHWCGIRVGL